MATTAKKKEGCSDKKFQSIEDVDAKIRRLKAPLLMLTREDFMHKYELPHEGNNPHCFHKNTIHLEALKNLFGARYGDLRRAGFCWLNCKVPEVVARIKFLHSILYQHDPGEIPNNVKVKFVGGMTFEYEEGASIVETNACQLTCYNQDLAKLQALIKTFEGKGNVDVRGKEWQSIKVKLETEMRISGATLPRAQ